MVSAEEIEYWRKQDLEKAERDRISFQCYIEELRRDHYAKSVIIGQMEAYSEMIPEFRFGVLGDPYGYPLGELGKMKSNLWSELKRRIKENPQEMRSRMLKSRDETS